MPRALWTGALSFGLVNVPVQLVSAVRDLDVHFNQLHEKDAAPIDVRRFCSKEDKEVDWEEIAHAYELDSGKQVVLTDDELAAAEPRKTRTIDIEEFVDLADVDPIYFDHPYFLVPQGESEGVKRAYQLLVEVMQSTDRAALGRIVLRTKEYLVAIRVRDGALALTTMLFHDEIRPVKDVDIGAAKKPAKKELDEAAAVIKALATDWDPSRYQDRYRKRLQKLVRDKSKGKTIKPPKEAEEPAPASDLMEALRKTLDELRGDGKGNGKAASGKKRAKAKA